MQQRTQEWLELRKKFIGASDAPIIMGVSPWKTKIQLWEEKLGLKESPPITASMQYGIDQEPVALELYNAATGNEAKPKIVFSDENKFMMCSLDGYCEKNNIAVEIKTASEKDHETASNGSVPEKYYPQLQHQLAVLNADVLHYFSFRNGDYCLIEVQRNESYIQELIEKEKEFYRQMQEFEEPSFEDADYVEKDDEEWKRVAIELQDVHNELAQLKVKEKICKQLLIEMSDGRSCKGAGIKVRRTIAKGAIDYKAIPELQNVDLEKYRKKSTEKWVVTYGKTT